MKYFVMGALLAMSGASSAEIYNHGNHNDDNVNFFNGTETFNCGSLSIYDCVELSTVQAMTENRCESKVPNTDNGGLFPYGAAYYHSVNSWNITIQSVTGPSPYTMSISYSCSGLYHPAELSKL